MSVELAETDSEAANGESSLVEKSLSISLTGSKGSRSLGRAIPLGEHERTSMEGSDNGLGNKSKTFYSKWEQKFHFVLI